MIIEYLYSDVADLYGDSFNVEYLAECCENTEIIRTEFNQEPYFVKHHVDLIYMGSMMERYQQKIIEQLKPYKEKLQELIENNTFFLITGNALEIFGEKIDDIEGIGLFDFYAQRDFSHHHNSCFLGNFNNIKIVGFKSLFSNSSPCDKYFINVEKGYGFKNSDHEGIKYRNFYATYLIGPLLILNPLFTEYLLKEMGVNYNLKYREDLINAYEIRLEEYMSYKEFKEFKH
ncbi:MAG: hypothetical protein Q4C64_00820 [Erysipelotrichia bacterium]|nr:hypothetical protein [Erysipelotrichia bacterium]